MLRKRWHGRTSSRLPARLFAAVDEVGIVVFFGALTAADVDVLADQIRRAPRPVRVDLALVVRLDAAGLSELLELDARELDATGMGIEVTARSAAVERALLEAGCPQRLSGAATHTTGQPATHAERGAGGPANDVAHPSRPTSDRYV